MEEWICQGFFVNPKKWYGQISSDNLKPLGPPDVFSQRVYFQARSPTPVPSVKNHSLALTSWRTITFISTRRWGQSWPIRSEDDPAKSTWVSTYFYCWIIDILAMCSCAMAKSSMYCLGWSRRNKLTVFGDYCHEVVILASSSYHWDHVR